MAQLIVLASRGSEMQSEKSSVRVVRHAQLEFSPRFIEYTALL